MLQLNDRVTLDGFKVGGNEVTGKVVGFGDMFDWALRRQRMVLVELDEIFRHWYRNEMTGDKIMYHRILAVDESNLTLHIRAEIKP